MIRKIIGSCIVVTIILGFIYSYDTKNLSSYAYTLAKQDTEQPTFNTLEDTMEILDTDYGAILALSKNNELFEFQENEKEVKLLSNVKTASFNKSNHITAIKKNGQLWAWGVRLIEMTGNFINNDKNTENHPIKIFDHVKDICSFYISADEYENPHNICILTNNSEVFATGDKILWDKEKSNSKTPIKVMSNVKEFTLNNQYNHVYLINNEGVIFRIDKNDQDTFVPYKFKPIVDLNQSDKLYNK